MIRCSQNAIVVLFVAAVSAFAETREEEAKRYAGELKSKEAKVRLNAARELGKLGQLQRKLAAPYVADMTRALTDADAAVRGAAAEALGLVDPEDKKAAVTKIAELLKSEKSEVARTGQEMGLGELGATADDADVKRMAREALQEARKKTDSKREQKVIQAALLLITGPKKKKD
jgi:HEAT repeat protein